MNMNQSKVNQILGLFSILNGIELSLARNSDCGIFDPEYVQFDCSFTFDDRYDTWYCDLTSIKMRLCRDMLTGSDSRYPQNAF